MQLDDLRLDLAGFDASAYPLDLSGWGSTAPIFEELLTTERPRLIIEVGTWKGASAIHMAALCDQLGLDARIVCVDTWLGAYEMWSDTCDPERYGSLRRRWGYPTVYEQFLANVVHTGHADRILALPQTSQIAARLFWHAGIRADLIYIDASHDEADVAADICAFVPLVRPGGVLFGDDFDAWPSVQRAVQASGFPFTVTNGRYWRIDR